MTAEIAVTSKQPDVNFNNLPHFFVNEFQSKQPGATSKNLPYLNECQYAQALKMTAEIAVTSKQPAVKFNICIMLICMYYTANTGRCNFNICNI